MLALQRPGRRVDLVQVLAPHELDPGLLGLDAVAWIDREGGGRVESALGASELARYGEALTQRLEAWRRLCARHGLACSAWSSATPFEDVVRSLLEL